MLDFYDHGFGTITRRRPIPLCRWDQFDLLCVHEGGLDLRFERSSPTRLHAGEGVLIYPRTRFRGEPVGPSCRISVQHFSSRFARDEAAAPEPLRDLPGREHGYEPVAMPPGSPVASDIRRAIDVAFDSDSPEMVQAVREALTALILAQVRRTEPRRALPSHSRWAALDQQLRQNPAHPGSIEALAREMDLSPSHFRTRFREEFGQSPAAYLKRLRLEEAMRLLRETDLPIKAIAQRLGYRDLANFYRAFRRGAGSPPARYRQQQRIRG